jgi:arginine decarboxylase
MYVPSEVFLVSGVGRHAVPVASFEHALRDAGVEPYNLVPVSSILPPDAEFVEPHEGVELLSPGQVVHAVLGRDTTREGKATAAVGVARADEGHGYFVERGGTKDAADRAERDSAETLAREMVGTSEMTGDVEESFSVEATAVAENGTDGHVTAVAAAVLVPPEGISGASS